ncbi:MAG: type II toxin-antitoxin system VapC family toxin [Devosia sp.]|nr:type II toxin-antitoxin system VapC family toxin [Devosia sp.]
MPLLPASQVHRDCSSWLAGHGAEQVLVSEWGQAGLRPRRFRSRSAPGQITPEEQRGRDELDLCCERSRVRLRVTTAHFRLAADLAAQVESGLRSGDALHVATAAATEGTIVTLDRGMSRAAQHLQSRLSLLA